MEQRISGRIPGTGWWVVLWAAVGVLVTASGCQRTEEPSFQPDDDRSSARAEGNEARPAAGPATAGDPAETDRGDEGSAEPPTPAEAAEGDDAEEADGEAAAGEQHPALLDPSRATERAPDEYTVELQTTAGPILIDVERAWAPKGADRFYNLVKIGYFEDVAFFRVIDGFMAQAGISGDPAVTRAWRSARIQDDPPTQSNTRGMVTFATSGPNSRTTQFFINFVDNSRLDRMGFAPFGKVRDMKNVDALHAGYGESAPRGRGPKQGDITSRGNAYLKAEFPELDYIESARIVEDDE